MWDQSSLFKDDKRSDWNVIQKNHVKHFALYKKTCRVKGDDIITLLLIDHAKNLKLLCVILICHQFMSKNEE